jgi:hypothetical protein
MSKRPSPPITVWPLAFVACAGLVAQFLAARSAFGLISESAWQSIAAALLIEAATVTEALVFVRSGNRWAAGGLGLTMVVSATYNYTQASGAGADLGQWQLIAMSVGPLAALVSVGLALGDELRKYEATLAEWAMVQDELAQEQVRLERAEAVRLEREARDRLAWERQMEQRRVEAELERQAQAQVTRLKEEGLARRRAERAARKVGEQQAVSDRSVSGQEVTSGQSDRRWPDKSAFLTDPDRPSGLTAGQLAEMAGVSERTARRWQADVRSDNGRGHNDTSDD